MRESWKAPAVGLLSAAFVLGAPAPSAKAFSVCSPGWSCVFADNGEKDGLWATNNPEYDSDMTGYGQDNRTRSATNRGKGYMGLYRDPGLKGLMMCLPPGKHDYHVPPGVVSGIKYHANRVAACGPPPRVKPKATATPKPTRSKTKTKAPETETRKNLVPSVPRSAPPSATLPAPSANVQLPQVVQGPQGVEVAAESADNGGRTQALVAGVGAGTAGLALLGMLGGGVLVARRRVGGRPKRVAGSADVVDRGLRLLAVDCVELGIPLPRVRTVAVVGDELVVVLAEPSEDAPTPWRAVGNGQSWRLAVNEITELTDDVREAPAPFPLLVPVEPGVWVNLLGVPGPVSLDGSRGAVRKAAGALARGLRAAPWSAGVRIRTIGTVDVGETSDDGPERGRVVFVAEDMRAPGAAPAGGAMVALGEISGSGTRWPVRADGTIRLAEPALRPAEMGNVT